MADKYDRLVSDYLNGKLAQRIDMLNKRSENHEYLPFLQLEYDVVQSEFNRLNSDQQNALKKKYVKREKMRAIAYELFVDVATIHRWKNRLKDRIETQLEVKVDGNA